METQRKKNQNEIYNEYQNAVYNSEDIQTTQDSYDLRRQENYIGLLDRELELEASKQNALKYTQNQMANQGLASQGYGSSVNAGIYNQYANAFQQAQSDYNFEQAGLDLEERQTIQAQQQRNMENLDSLINNASSPEELEKIYEQYGFGTYDEDGNFVLGNKPEGMSQFDWTRYGLKYDQMTGGSTTTTKNEPYTFDTLSTGTYTTLNGEERNIGQDFNEELLIVKDDANSGKYKNGDVIEVVGKDPNHRLYLKYRNGEFTVVTRDDYVKANNLPKESFNKDEFIEQYGSQYGNSIDKLYDFIYDGLYKEGDAFEIVDNKHKNPIYVYYSQGSIRIITKEEYKSWKSSKKHSVDAI